ncbi:hypothetical protein [Comamonas flocculans]|nr:hypothetical protein [Comamonas flocculans]
MAADTTPRAGELPASEAQGGALPLARQLEVMDLLSYIYLQHGLPDKAAVLLGARDVLAPDDARALLMLALAQVRSAKPQRALATLERLALAGAMDAAFHLVRAQALQAQGQAQEAASAMRAYVRLRDEAAAPSHGDTAAAVAGA